MPECDHRSWPLHRCTLFALLFLACGFPTQRLEFLPASDDSLIPDFWYAIFPHYLETLTKIALTVLRRSLSCLTSVSA